MAFLYIIHKANNLRECFIKCLHSTNEVPPRLVCFYGHLTNSGRTRTLSPDSGGFPGIGKPNMVLE